MKQNGDETKSKIKAKKKERKKENKPASKQAMIFYYYYFIIITSSSSSYIRWLLHLLAISDEANLAMTHHSCCIPLLLL